MANQTWEFREFPGPRPDGENNAVTFLNEPARQGPGEATATLRNDGSAGLLYLAPGSLGTGTTQTWESAEFAGPKQAVDFLNEPARQGVDGARAGCDPSDGVDREPARLPGTAPVHLGDEADIQ